MSEPAALADALEEVDELLSFAARRSTRLTSADSEIAPIVRRSLPEGDWTEVVEAASVLWLEIFQEIAPDAQYEGAMHVYQNALLSALARTRPDAEGIYDAQIALVSRYVGTATVNDATMRAASIHGTARLRWVSEIDEDTRPTHRAANGQVIDSGERFDVGDARLRYPGDPLGPAEEVINCRCLIAPVDGQPTRRELMASLTETDLDAEEELDEGELEGADLVDDTVEVPWHALLAPEEQSTGDGRMFAADALTWRELPIPLLYQHTTGDSHAGSVRVGRIDEIWRDESTATVRARGVFNSSPEAQQVIQGIYDGSVRGVSVDVDDIEIDFSRSQDSTSEANPMGMLVFARARVSALTIVAIPAYQEAYIAIGPAFEDELTDADREALAACGCDSDVGDYLEFRDYSPEERRRLADEGKALPDGSFPIVDEEDLRNAIQAIGRAGDRAAAIAHIKKRARDLGLEELIPEGWGARSTTASVVADDTFAVGTKDGPGWITNPRATSRIRRYWTHGKGAAKIRWGQPGDFNRCRRELAKYVENPEWLAGTCANMHKEALGIWPGMERGGRHSILTAVPAVTFTASAAPVMQQSADAFQNPHLEGPTPLTVSTNRVYGHLATWGACHIGIKDVCTTAPHSPSNYAYFRTGVVDTVDGPIPVGQITIGTGHAQLGESARAAAAHYDNTGAVIADIAVGEDAYGIWVAGLLRPTVTPEDVAALKAAALSGDWRDIGGHLELVAALAVNVPGFPIPRTAGLAASAGTTTSLVSVGVVEQQLGMDAERIAAITRTAVQEYMAEMVHQAEIEEARERANALREQVRSLRVAAVREKVK